MANTRTLQTLILGLLAGPVLAAQAEPRTKVSLHPAVSALTPGATFEVAVRFQLAEGWHIYWKNPGDAGLPPRIDWKLPEGFEVGEWRFPVPKRHLDPGNLQTNILEGEPVLLQSLTAPQTLQEGQTVTLAAELRWLACKEACIPEKASVSIELPVGGTGGPLDPQDNAVLEQARRALPISPDKAKHVIVSASTATQTLKPGQTFEAVLDLSVAAGHHIQSNQPSVPTFIPTHVFVEPGPGLDIGKIIYPPPEEHAHPQLGKLTEYRGKVRIRIPAQMRDDATGPTVRVAGVVTSQACNDKTLTCYPPEHVAWQVEVPLDRERAAGFAPAEQERPADFTPADTGLDVPTNEGDALQRFLTPLGLPGLLLGCFLYGLFINATPCVLPLLSIKVLGFVQQAHESRRRTAVLGVLFGLGVMVFFVVLGFLAAAGSNILQFPQAVIALGAIVLALALSMLGVYTLQVPSTATKLEASFRREGVLASFGKGALAPVLGFACTGPLLAGAFGWATQQPPKIAVLAFVVTGLGMASPYMLLGANPKWLSFLPKPGAWMVTFERIMGFLLLAMVIWLLNPLVQQIGAAGLQWTMVFLVAVATSCWLLGQIDVNMEDAVRWRYRGGAALLVLGVGGLIYAVICPLGEAQTEQRTLAANPHDGSEETAGIPWRTWSPEAVQEAVRAGQTVFVDFTAAWCTVCKVNKKVAINTPEVRDKIQALGIVCFRGDFTSADSLIAEELKKHGRAGPPLNLIYPAGQPDAPIVLRPNLTRSYLLEKLETAGPSRTPADRPASQADPFAVCPPRTTVGYVSSMGGTALATFQGPSDAPRCDGANLQTGGGGRDRPDRRAGTSAGGSPE